MTENAKQEQANVRNNILFCRWNKIMKRLDSIAVRHHASYNLVTLTVLIGPDGEPKFWTEPQIVRLEPKGVRISDFILELTGIPQLVLTDNEDE